MIERPDEHLGLQPTPVKSPNGQPSIFLLSEVSNDAAHRARVHTPEKRCLLCDGRLWERFLHVNGCRFSRCWRCGSVMWNPRWNSSDASRFYNSEYYRLLSHNDALRSTRTRGIPLGSHLTDETLDWAIAAAVSTPRPAAVRALDVGCGSGGLLHELRRRYGILGKGIEISHHYSKVWEQFDIDASIESLEHHLATGARYDLVFCSEVVEHVMRPGEFIRSLMKLLHEKGSLILTTPNIGRLAPLLVKNVTGLISPPNHINLVTRRGFEILARKLGAKATVRTFGMPAFSFEGWAKSFELVADHCANLYEYTGDTVLIPRPISIRGSKARRDFVARFALPKAAGRPIDETLEEELEGGRPLRSRLVRKIATTPFLRRAAGVLEAALQRSDGCCQMVCVITAGEYQSLT
jgi:SAM-dependent methyltransferase